MNKQTLKGDWHVIKGKLKEKYGELTDDDLTYVEGKEEQLLGNIERKTGRTKEELTGFINSLFR